MEAGTKKCARCQRIKALSAYYRRLDGGPQSWCQECQSEYSRARAELKRPPKEYALWLSREQVLRLLTVLNGVDDGILGELRRALEDVIKEPKRVQAKEPACQQQ